MTHTKTMLVTGGGIGIGRATALAFARAGHHVVVTDILEAEGRAAVAAITSAGGSASFAALDVRSSAQVDAVVAATIASHGAIDVLVLNAGIAHKVPLAQLNDAAWDHTYNQYLTITAGVAYMDFGDLFGIDTDAGMRVYGQGRLRF